MRGDLDKLTYRSMDRISLIEHSLEQLDITPFQLKLDAFTQKLHQIEESLNTKVTGPELQT
jgi:hypothetical protein